MILVNFVCKFSNSLGSETDEAAVMIAAVSKGFDVGKDSSVSFGTEQIIGYQASNKS